jgi:hypothetical protein
MELREGDRKLGTCITLIPESQEEIDALLRFFRAFDSNRDGYTDVNLVDEGLHIHLVDPH